MDRSLRFADAAGVIGAALAALGLGFLRKDAIIVPFMSLALLIAVGGF